MPEGRDETPVQEFIKYKENIELFYDEIAALNGPANQKAALIKHLAPLKGVADSQESLMMLVMDPELTNFTIPKTIEKNCDISKFPLRNSENRDQFCQAARGLFILDGLNHCNK